MRRSRLRIAFLLITGFVAVATPSAAESGRVRELSVAPSVSWFQWEERVGGVRLLKEDGPLFGVSGGFRMDLLPAVAGQTMTLSVAAELYGGVVSYDGHAQSDTPKYDNRPLTTDVGYIGGHGGFDLGWMVPFRKSRLGPLAGLDYRLWVRDLRDGTAIDTEGVPFLVSGSTEFWQNVTLRLGLRWEEIPLGGEWRLFVEGGAVYPVYTANQIDVADYGSVTIKPEGEWSARGELGIRRNNLRFAVTYEGLRFGRSPTVVITPVKGYFQPESSGDVVGFSVGYCFR